LAAERAKLISNTRYDVRLSLEDPEMAHGAISMRFQAKRSADVIIDFRGPSISRVEVNGSAANVSHNDAHVRIPASAIHAGENTVTADFTTPIAAAGAAIIKSHDDKDGSDYLYTLLV